jgi:hypothetical protein
MNGNKFKANTVIAIKLARAVFFMLKNRTVFDPERLIAASNPGPRWIYRLKLIPAGLPPSQGGRTAQKGSQALPYTSLQAALRLHPCRALASAEAG